MLIIRLGMERYKLPAGQLATIFYTGSSRAQVPVETSDTLGDEKGMTDPDVPPQTTTMVVAEDDDHLQSVSSHHGRTLSWHNITLELKAQGEVKRLLDGLTGRSSKIVPCMLHCDIHVG